jgi:hypothetical protein
LSAFETKPIDTIGAGDAYFVVTSLLEIINTKSALIPFLGNVYAGMHTMNLANKNIPLRIDYIKYLKSILTF